MAAASSSRSFLSQGEASSEAGSAGPQGLPGRIKEMHSQRNSAREKERSRSPQQGNERRSSFMNTTNCNSSTGRRRKRTSLPDHDNTHRDDTAAGPSNRSCQHAPAHRAACEQPLPRERRKSRPSQQGDDLCRQFVKSRDDHQPERKRRKHSFGTNRPKAEDPKP